MDRIDELTTYLNNQARRIADIESEIKFYTQRINSLECDKARELMVYEDLLEEYKDLVEFEEQTKGGEE